MSNKNAKMPQKENSWQETSPSRNVTSSRFFFIKTLAPKFVHHVWAM